MPQEELSSKDLMMLFLDKQTYEQRHGELQKRMDVLENKFDTHLAWANERARLDRDYLNSQITQVNRTISDKLEVARKDIKQSEQNIMDKIEEERSMGWNSKIARTGWLIAIISPLLAVLVAHFLH